MINFWLFLSQCCTKSHKRDDKSGITQKDTGIGRTIFIQTFAGGPPPV